MASLTATRPTMSRAPNVEIVNVKADVAVGDQH